MSFHTLRRKQGHNFFMMRHIFFDHLIYITIHPFWGGFLIGRNESFSDLERWQVFHCSFILLNVVHLVSTIFIKRNLVSIPIFIILLFPHLTPDGRELVPIVTKMVVVARLVVMGTLVVMGLVTLVMEPVFWEPGEGLFPNSRPPPFLVVHVFYVQLFPWEENLPLEDERRFEICGRCLA